MKYKQCIRTYVTQLGIRVQSKTTLKAKQSLKIYIEPPYIGFKYRKKT